MGGPFRLLPLVIALAATFLLLAASEPTQDRAALLSFLSQTPHEGRLKWNNSTSACNWPGVSCDANRTAVIALHLPGVGLVGPIPPGTLSRLTNLRVLSLHSNRLSGPIPSDLANLTLLRNLYLRGNLFSGGIPAGLGKMTHLTRLDLSANNLTGEIPVSVNNLTRLTGLFLENNSFSGEIPSIDVPGLTAFDVSYNRLNGSVPKSLGRFPSSSFAGNLDLCGGPLPPCSPYSPSPAPSQPGVVEKVQPSSKKKLSKAAIIAISVVAGAILLLALLLLLLVFRRRRGGAAKPTKTTEAAVPRSGAATTAETASSSTKDDIGGGGSGETERNKLVFFENGLYSFDLEDLLRASAEVLGKGSIGTSYKAVLEDGTTVVVKRLKDVTAAKKEFEVQMDVLGKVKHSNAVPLRAFYYSKDEKLLVYDYMPAGSLSAMLHGSRGTGRTLLDWENRLRIAVAAGRGLAHFHATNVVHGNVKASNILLRADQEAAAVADCGLSQLFGTGGGGTSRVGGYRAPEVVETRRATLKSDVYSFGVVLLELLTGKAPNQAAAAAGEEGMDLPRWVQSVVREEWTAEVFDVEVLRYGGQNTEEEMVQLLQIAMACVSMVPDLRPDMANVVRMVEEIANRVAAESSDDPSKNGTPPAATTP